MGWGKPREEGRKDDVGKDRWDLLPVDSIKEFVKVLTFGAEKYNDRNWESGIRYGRCYSAALRHLTAWWSGEELDKETGLNHLAHALCCVAFLLAYRLRKMDSFDDRPIKTPKPGELIPIPTESYFLSGPTGSTILSGVQEEGFKD